MSKDKKIKAVISMNNEEYVSHLSGNNIEEIIEKIKEWHAMDAFLKEHLEKRGKLEKAIKSGWYTKESIKSLQVDVK